MKPYHFNAAPNLFVFARQLRKKQTLAEKELWEALRNRRFKGYKFRRQHPFGKYIPDFYCHSAKLCIEVDGAIHKDEDVKQMDEIRQEAIESCGIKVIRFTNDEIMDDKEKVLARICEELGQT
jgi:very-short-patch-repair endonuclease